MMLEKLALIAEIIGGIVIVIPLIFLIAEDFIGCIDIELGERHGQ